MKITRARQKPIVETQMISLADIAFLVIFFFLLTSTFMRDKLGITLPVVENRGKTESPITVILDKEGQIFLNGQPVGSPDALERELKGMLAERTTTKEAEVRLRCEKTLKYSQYRPIYEAISHAGGVIAIMHELPRK